MVLVPVSVFPNALVVLNLNVCIYIYIYDRLEERLDISLDVSLIEANRHAGVFDVCFRLTKKSCQNLTKTMADFWWNALEQNMKFHWIIWKQICITKQ